MSGKRKPLLPVKADEAKRRQMSWNMTDIFTQQGNCSAADDTNSLVDAEQQSYCFQSTRSEMSYDDHALPEMSEQDAVEQRALQRRRGKKKSVTKNNETINPHLAAFITECAYYLEIETNDSTKDECRGLLGSFALVPSKTSLASPVSLSSFSINPSVSSFFFIKDVVLSGNRPPQLWLYVNKKTGKHLLYTEFFIRDSRVGGTGYFRIDDLGDRLDMDLSKQVSNAVVETNFSVDCFDALLQKDFAISLRKNDSLLADFVSDGNKLHRDLMILDVYILNRGFAQISSGCDAFDLKKRQVALQTLMQYFHGFTLEDYSGRSRTLYPDIYSLYDEIGRRHQDEEMTDSDHLVNVQHVSLRPCLREYQRRAVKWMLAQENYQTNASPIAGNLVVDDLHCLYTEVSLGSQTAFYNHYAGIISGGIVFRLVRRRPTAVRRLPGGILADEMGLGKTVEILACVLIHKRSDLPAVEPMPVLERVEVQKAKTRRCNSKKCPNVNQENTRLSSSSSSTASNFNIFHDEKTLLSSNNPNYDMPKTNNENICDTSDDILHIRSDIKSFYKGNSSITRSCLDETTIVQDLCLPDSLDIPEISCGSDEHFRDVAYSIEIETARVDSSVSTIENVPDDSSVTDTASEVSLDIEKRKNGKHKGSVIKSLLRPRQKSSDIVKSIRESKYLEPDSRSAVLDTGAPVECICGGGGGTLVVDVLVEGLGEVIGQSRRLMRTDGGSSDTRSLVVCESCKARLHADCMNYDLSDPWRGRFLCPHCHVNSPPIASGATLIITPQSICHQWVEEILKHINSDSLQLFVYTGVHRQGFIQPNTLARQDVVLTTYETLRKEIDYVDLPHRSSDGSRILRHPKRFMAVPSPITAVEWWRICLDEAQMVETTTTKTAEMARRLCAVNRWCVTGTPIQRGITDLYGLLLFLGMDPFHVREWWTKLLYEPYCFNICEPLHSVLANIFWRTAKKDVADQIGLPDQTVEMHWLTFSPVEQHFYRRQYEECASDGRRKLSSLTDRQQKLNCLDRHTLHRLLTPLLHLRQACCHPQAVRGAFLPMHRSAMTMEELLTDMTKKVKYECEEAQRQIVFACNGLAGLHRIHQNYVDAVGEYREVLRCADENKEKVRTDDLQLLHTIANLREVLTLAPLDLIGRTLRDSTLEDQEKEIRNKYTSKVVVLVTTAREAWTPMHQSVLDIERELGHGSQWWIEFIQWTVSRDLDDALIESVKLDLSNNLDYNNEIYSMSRRFHDAHGLQYVLTNHLDSLKMLYKALITALRALDTTPSNELILATVNCCLRPTVQQLHKCSFCSAHKLFEDLESKLFLFVSRGMTEASTDEREHGGVLSSFQVSTKRQGTWADSEAEKTLRSLMTFASRYSAVSGIRHLVTCAQRHIKLFDALKKEFKAMRSLWMALREQICSLDELSMATTRLRVREVNEPIADPPLANVIEASELQHQRLKFVSDRIIGRNELRRKMGQMLYLQNLAKAHTNMENGINPDICPICQQQLGHKWTVLQCGHCFCLPCVRVLVDRYSFGSGAARSLRCAVCRQRTRHADISYVSLNKGSVEQSSSSSSGSDEDKTIVIKGDYSTKIVGVVRCLRKIHNDDVTAKVLVFSTWQDVLDVIAQALTDNDIKFRSLHTHNKFESNLDAFRHDADIWVLLLPVHSGSNGLNLTEATHVILVEPILSTAQELQAIGRVHRIGQTRPTVVHRFLVRGTIEEYMHAMLQSRGQAMYESHNPDQTSLTVGDLHDLFALEPVDDEYDDDAMDSSSNHFSTSSIAIDNNRDNLSGASSIVDSNM